MSAAVTMTTPDTASVLKNVEAVAADWAGRRSERQQRRSLDPADFEQLREAGYPRASLPIDQGGLWESYPSSSRLTSQLLRTLAHGDSSVALVAAMHPGVLSTAGWLGSPAAPPPFAEAWKAQRDWVFQTVRDGAWWGTSMSEPGRGGDVSLTRAVAKPEGSALQSLAYRITGQKHFASGSGIMSYMITSAVPEGETAPDIFFVNMRDVGWDGSTGVRVTAAWDGHGMPATQSHALEFVNCPATRLAWPSSSRGQAMTTRAGGLGFSAVVVGIVEVAVKAARGQLARRQNSLHPYEQTEWSRVEVDAWLIHQASEGMLQAMENDDNAARSALLGKTAIAELAESVLTRICRIVGGSAYSRHIPYGFWLEDVRALGFLRPPWGLAYEQIFADSWDTP